jgi:hypothetical protein
MVDVWKRIRGDRGETRVGPLLRLPLRVERSGGRTVLAYEPPLSALVDEISPAGRDLWHGRATSAACPSSDFVWSGSGTTNPHHRKTRHRRR